VSSRWKRRVVSFWEEDFQFPKELNEGRLESLEGQRRHCAEGDARSSTQRLGKLFWR